jgi:hypothetical protein
VLRRILSREGLHKLSPMWEGPFKVTHIARPGSACRGDDLGGAPRAGQYAGWHPRKSHGFSTRRPAPLEGPAAPAAG